MDSLKSKGASKSKESSWFISISIGFWGVAVSEELEGGGGTAEEEGSGYEGSGASAEDSNWVKGGAEFGSFRMWWKDGDAPLPEERRVWSSGLTSGGEVEGRVEIDAAAV